jgi:hypothetical protein
MGEVLESIWPPKRASLLFTLVTAAVVIGLMTAAGARADEFDDAQAALEQAVAQTGGAPPPVAPAKKPEPAKKSWDSNGGVAAPAPDPATDNVNISIRVQSPGNDGPVIQQSNVSDADFDRMERDFDKKFDELKKQIKAQTPSPKVVMPVMRHVAAKAPKAPPPRPKQVRHVATTLTHPRPGTRDPRPPAKPVAPSVHHRRSHKAVTPMPPPFQLPDNQAMSAGSSGGTSTPPPAPIAVLLAAACLAASMLVTSFWDAHRRRRSRLFASRLERPG